MSELERWRVLDLENMEPDELYFLLPEIFTLEETRKDRLLTEAMKILLAEGKASVSDLQRMLNIGHPRAGRLLDMISRLGIAAPLDRFKTCRLLMAPEEVEHLIKSMEHENMRN